MSLIPELANLPEISFIDDHTQAQIVDEVFADYAAYMQQAGQDASLPGADPRRLILLSMADIWHQLFQAVDAAGKANFLRYAAGDYLDHLGAFKRLTRNPAARAQVTMQFSLTSARQSATGVPAGTRVSDAGENYFATDEYFEIPAGQTSGTVTATAVTAGTAANGLPAGAVNILVDQTPYVAAVVNTDASSGGTEIESDESFTRRIYLAPYSWSAAGPIGAYEWWARQSRADIADVVAWSPEPMHVQIVFTVGDNALPDEGDCTQMEQYLSDETIRPTGDRVQAVAPEETAYNIVLSYYISRADSAKAGSIQQAVTAAIADYVAWQRKIGRDIIPSELIHRIMEAGARRVALTEPAYTIVGATQIAKCAAQTITYGGLEDD